MQSNRVDLTSYRHRAWDPYLIWAQEGEFHRYIAVLGDSSGTPNKRANSRVVAVLLELDRPYASEAAIRQQMEGAIVSVPDMYFSGFRSRFVSATVPRRDLEKLFNSKAVVRLQLAVPRRVNLKASGPLVSVSVGAKRRIVVGVVDDSCAYANRSFRTDSGATRIVSIWNQSEMIKSPNSPADTGYGVQRTRTRPGAKGLLLQPRITKKVDLASLSDEQWYRHPDVADMRVWPRALHGTHVLDLAAGSPRPGLTDAPSPAAGAGPAEAELIFVELPGATVADVSGASLGSAALDGIRYIMARAPAKQTDLVINLSYGHFAGPHDSTGLFTEAMTDLLLNRDGFAITVPAGNSHFPGRPIHVKCDELKAGAQAEVAISLLPQDRTPTFIEVWVPENSCKGVCRSASSKPCDGDDAELEFQIQTPEGSKTGWAAVGSAEFLRGSKGTLLAGVIYLDKVSQGKRGRMALIAVEAAVTNDGAPLAPAGDWTIRVRNQGKQHVCALHAWVERHDVQPARPNQGLQPFFKEVPRSGLFKSTGKRYTLNAIAHGPLTLCGGGLVLNRGGTDYDPDYAGNGPGRNAPAMPAAQVLSDAGKVLSGVRAAGSASGSTVRLSGTSASSALLARYVANRLQAEPLQIPAKAIRLWFAAATLRSELADRKLDDSLVQRPFP
jgi:hypothetical protein